MRCVKTVIIQKNREVVKESDCEGSEISDFTDTSSSDDSIAFDIDTEYISCTDDENVDMEPAFTDQNLIRKSAAGSKRLHFTSNDETTGSLFNSSNRKGSTPDSSETDESMSSTSSVKSHIETAVGNENPSIVNRSLIEKNLYASSSEASFSIANVKLEAKEALKSGRKYGSTQISNKSVKPKTQYKRIVLSESESMEEGEDTNLSEMMDDLGLSIDESETDDSFVVSDNHISFTSD